MLNRNRPEEEFIIDDEDIVYNAKLNKKDKDKKIDVVNNFDVMSRKRDCTKIKYEENDTFVKYTAKYKSRIPMSITINKNYLEDNKDIIERLNKCKEKKDEYIKRKLIVYAEITGLVLVGSVALVKIHKHNKAKFDKKNNNQIENDYGFNPYENPYFEEMRLENQKNEEEAMEQLYQDNIKKEKEDLEKANELQQTIDNYNKEQEENMINNLEQLRNFDEIYGNEDVKSKSY